MVKRGPLVLVPEINVDWLLSKKCASKSHRPCCSRYVRGIHRAVISLPMKDVRASLLLTSKTLSISKTIFASIS